jgi:methylglutamate dehydrogenase subunit D
LPLQTMMRPGRFGAAAATPGVTFTLIYPMTLVAVIARKGQGKSLAAKLKGMPAMWAGPDQYFVEGHDAGLLKLKVGNTASVVDQSHGRVTLRIAGPKARSVLGKGTPVDVHPAQFPIGKSALTQMAHIGVHLTRTGEDEFNISVFRGFSESFWEWLSAAAAEYGYAVS